MAITEINYENIENMIPISSPIGGISSIKEDQKTSIYNTYLDSCTLVVNSTTGTSVDFDLTSPSFENIIGKYKRQAFATTGGEGAIKFPVAGTYIINVNMNDMLAGTSTESLITILDQDDGIVGICASVTNSLNFLQYGSVSFVSNINDGDYLYFRGATNDTGGAIRMKLSIIKLT